MSPTGPNNETDSPETPEGLTPEQIAYEEKLMEGIPRVNVGALFMPGIWGPAHGRWICIAWYPIWLFADNVFFGAYSNPTVLNIVLAAVVFVVLAAIQVAFAILEQPRAARKAAAKGKTRARFLSEERIWAVACVIIGVVFLAVATYYNLAVRPPLQ